MGEEYSEYGLKIGLEIHFQLDTGRKLFCRCPSGIMESVEGFHFLRRLRPTQSELGQVDPAAYFEFKKGLTIEYVAPPRYCCLVEMDEEPPHPIDKEALETVLRIAMYMHSFIVDEVHVMRKIVVDGSNTTGFQRTTIVGLGGYIDVKELNKKVPIQTICLEEEAARLIKRAGRKAIYYLDRLGIPLVEIATAPVIHSPEEAATIALCIGRIVAATGRKRRGLGSVRQDINISIMDGNIVEVKGVQKIPQLKKVIDFEFRRQVGLFKISKILHERGITKDIIISSQAKDVSDVFKNTKNRIIRRNLKRGDKVIGVLLHGFAGLISMETAPGYRLGKEFVERIRFWTGLKGIFHTDELPGYNISAEEVDMLRKSFEAGEQDAIVFVVAPEHLAYDAINRVVERAAEALDGVPSETRGSKEDGTTFYMRPRPGMARMYPETDIPPIRITETLLETIKEKPIRDPSDIVSAIADRYSLNKSLAWKLYDSEYMELFERIMDIVKSMPATFVASFFTDTLKYLEREGVEVDKIGDDVLIDAFNAVESGITEKEALVDIIKYCVENGVSVEKAIEALGLRKISSLEAVRDMLLNVLSTREDLKALPKNILRKRLMAIIMSEYRGRVDPKDVLNVIDELLEMEKGV